MAQTNFSECVRIIKSVSYALNRLEVKGRENLDILLGSIQSLDRTAAELERGLQEMAAPKSEPHVELEVVPADEGETE